MTAAEKTTGYFLTFCVLEVATKGQGKISLNRIFLPGWLDDGGKMIAFLQQGWCGDWDQRLSR